MRNKLLVVVASVIVGTCYGMQEADIEKGIANPAIVSADSTDAAIFALSSDNGLEDHILEDGHDLLRLLGIDGESDKSEIFDNQFTLDALAKIDSKKYVGIYSKITMVTRKKHGKKAVAEKRLALVQELARELYDLQEAKEAKNQELNSDNKIQATVISSRTKWLIGIAVVAAVEALAAVGSNAGWWGATAQQDC